MPRLEVQKTCKLFIKGAYPRSESGRTIEIADAKGRLAAHICRASRKDLREAVESARAAQPAWQGASPYLRGQIIYRLAEMLEGRAKELAESIRLTSGRTSASASKEVTASIDRIVCMAGWCDKLAMVLGGQNPVAGPYYNFTVPEPIGTVLTAAPDRAPLLGFLSLLLPAIAVGNTVVALAAPRHPLPAVLVSESMPAADVPPGVVNMLTADREELLPHLAGHRDLDAIAMCAEGKAAETLRAGVAENMKRVCVLPESEDFGADEPWAGARAFDPFVEFKTIWHPASA